MLSPGPKVGSRRMGGGLRRGHSHAENGIEMAEAEGELDRSEGVREVRADFENRFQAMG